MPPEIFFRAGLLLTAVVVLATVLAGATLWFRRLTGRSSRNLCGGRSPELLPAAVLPPPRWSVFDFLVMFGLMILVASLLNPPATGKAADEAPATAMPAPVESQAAEGPAHGATEDAAEQGSEQEAPVEIARRLRSQVVANLVALLGTFAYLRLIHGATLSHLTLVPRRDDLRCGVVATAWILAPVLSVNLLVSLLVPYRHAVTDFLGQQHDWQTFAWLFVSAAVITPVVEEFQFRLLLQGGLQQLADPPTETTWRPHAFWPIVVTSLFFGLMHWGQGAAPIPLFFLSLGLGFLYQRTGRLFPAIVVHTLLNAATLVMEFCRVNAGLG